MANGDYYPDGQAWEDFYRGQDKRERLQEFIDGIGNPSPVNPNKIPLCREKFGVAKSKEFKCHSCCTCRCHRAE